MNKTVFISRELDDDSIIIRNAREEGITLHATSLIQTESVRFELPSESPDWIFFSSSKAVYYFFDQFELSHPVKLAALGPGTARALAPFGAVEFIGHSNDIDQVGVEFAGIAEGDKVWFPGAEHSLGTIQKYLIPADVTNIPCYRTLPDPKPVGFPDVLVFSSPSNVESFFKTNQLKAFQKIIAFGKSTAEALSAHTRGPVIIPAGTSEKEIWGAIKAALFS